MDESKLGNCYAMSGILISKEEIDKKTFVSTELHDLAKKYYVDYFHFTEIFGNNIFNDRTGQFIEDFSKIASQLEMYPFSICMEKEEIEKFQKQSNITDEQAFISLQWQLMFKILIFITWEYGHELIIHIWREQEHITDEKRILHQENITRIYEYFPFAKISIYRHYEIFMKNQILYGSLSDLIAYFTTRVESRNIEEMSEKKIINHNYRIIKLVAGVFNEYKFIAVKNLDRYINKVLEGEEHINMKKASALKKD